MPGALTFLGGLLLQELCVRHVRKFQATFSWTVLTMTALGVFYCKRLTSPDIACSGIQRTGTESLLRTCDTY